MAGHGGSGSDGSLVLHTPHLVAGFPCWSLLWYRTLLATKSVGHSVQGLAKCFHLSVFCCTLCSLFVLCDLFSSIGGAIKPVVTFTPNWGNVLPGDDVTLTCDVPSTVPEEPRTYHWYKDKRPIPGDQERLCIFISSVERYSGDYQCRTIGGDISDPVFLNVTYYYVILQRPPSVIYEGDPLTLRCHHRRFFYEINTKFYKDDQEIQSSKYDSEFHIPNIMMNQSGLYKCTKQIQPNDRTYGIVRSDESVISVKGSTFSAIAAVKSCGSPSVGIGNNVEALRTVHLSIVKCGCVNSTVMQDKCLSGLRWEIFCCNRITDTA
ncbi:low affinity immunoglobulin gamma Fc region receptor III-A-like [Aquarana catesbeiana]|uniref:low affinity immunoglobulin gamma Fc region receptor III-A-like n=1 Tax=Aquarana catesbeiana TaxID=8400 RepID=UPI003CC92F90